MSLDFLAEVWDALRSHIDLNDRKDASDTLVTLLIENNYEADAIKDSFRGDKEILSALRDYASEHDAEYEEYDEDEDLDEEW